MSESNPNPHDPIPSELVRDDDSFAELVQEFVDGLSTRMREIERALTARDFAELRDLAHQLKGTAGGYGYPTLTRQAADLESTAMDEELAAITASLGDLQDMVARVVVRY
jgi:HPt (histidine-containing phosphotransfer) domain-containing protein